MCEEDIVFSRLETVRFLGVAGAACKTRGGRGLLPQTSPTQPLPLLAGGVAKSKDEANVEARDLNLALGQQTFRRLANCGGGFGRRGC